jgi:ribosomal protein S18 acetylase RimI-like enzyme
MNELITQSVDRNDITYVLEVLETYAPGADELQEQRAVLEGELSELGDNRLLYIAWEGSTPVGAVQLLMRHADNDPQLADGVAIAHVHHLRVRQERRRQGIGRRLMRHIESEAHRMGFQLLTLGVDSWNPEAMAFYRSLGYELLKEEPGPFPGTTLFYMQRNSGE